MYSMIVVGTDGSSTARRAVDEAIKLADLHDAVLHVVSAYKPLRASGAGTTAEHWAIHDDPVVDNILEEAASVARQRGVKVETHAERKDPAAAVVALAKRISADVIVVGNKGMKGAKRFLLGSVPNTIAHEAPCSVLIVKTT